MCGDRLAGRQGATPMHLPRLQFGAGSEPENMDEWLTPTECIQGLMTLHGRPSRQSDETLDKLRRKLRGALLGALWCDQIRWKSSEVSDARAGEFSDFWFEKFMSDEVANGYDWSCDWRTGNFFRNSGIPSSFPNSFTNVRFGKFSVIEKLGGRDWESWTVQPRRRLPMARHYRYALGLFSYKCAKNPEILSSVSSIRSALRECFIDGHTPDEADLYRLSDDLATGARYGMDMEGPPID